MDLYEQIEQTSSFLRALIGDFQPEVAIVLGTGLNGLTAEIEVFKEIRYADIPNFPVSTVQSHAGKLIFGTLAGRAVVAMAGRFHYYEGYSSQQATFPVRVFKRLAVKRLIITNAVGSVNASINMGDLVLIKDHINMQPENPLRGRNDERLGLRFPDMLGAYDAELNARCLAIAQSQQTPAHLGVYLATQGPNLETPAEYRFFNIIGADVVGMSAVPEVLVARHAQLPVLVVSVVSNKCYPIEQIQATSVQDVIEAVQKAEPKLTLLIKTVLEQAIF